MVIDKLSLVPKVNLTFDLSSKVTNFELLHTNLNIAQKPLG